MYPFRASWTSIDKYSQGESGDSPNESHEKQERWIDLVVGNG